MAWSLAWGSACRRSLLETQDAEVASFLRAFYLDCETLLAQVIAEGQQGGQFRSGLDPRVGAWDIISRASLVEFPAW